jgi:hypothetical protein
MRVQCDTGGSTDSKTLRTTVIKKELGEKQTWTRTHARNSKINIVPDFLAPRETSLCLSFSPTAHCFAATRRDGRTFVLRTDSNKNNNK